jgi:hypothetical protein
MAYTAVTTVTHKVINGRDHMLISVTETEAASSSEYGVTNVPVVGTIVHYKMTKTAGTGATVNLKIGRTPGFTGSTQDHVLTSGTTSAHVNDTTSTRYHSPSGLMYFRSTASNATPDHTILTEILIVEGVL